MTAAVQPTLLAADARNRALRVFLAGLAIDLAVAVALLVQDVASSTTEPDWRVLGGSLLRTVAQTTAAYVLRRFLDPSRLPTPLPPDPPGEPDRDVRPADPGYAVIRVLVQLLLIVGGALLFLAALTNAVRLDELTLGNGAGMLAGLALVSLGIERAAR